MQYKFDYTEIIPLVKLLVCKAGNAVMSVYQSDFEVKYKSDNSPVTKADILAEEIIRKGLTELTPDIPIIGEEGNKDFDISSGCFWLVDAIDGTREFIHKNGEFTINIALIFKSKPIFGVVFAPIFDELYFNDKNTAFLSKGGETFPISVRHISENISKIKEEGLVVFKSRSFRSLEIRREMLKGVKINKEITLGSSLKICRIAGGEAHLYPLAGTSHEWDIAAGHAILNASGGNIHTYPDNKELTYGKKDFLNPPLMISCF